MPNPPFPHKFAPFYKTPNHKFKMKKPYYIEKKLTINAKPEHIYILLTNIENWYQWTASVQKIVIQNNHPFALGIKVVVYQPKLRPNTWEITDIVPNHSFTWVSDSFGLKLTAQHIIEASQDGATVILTMQFEGLFAPLVYALSSRLTHQYMELEINGLKKESEKQIEA